MTQTQRENREQRARERAAETLQGAPKEFASPLTVLASPAWRGIEGDVWRARADSGSVVVKHYHPDTDFYVDAASSIEGAQQAGRLGLGPRVLASWPEDGMFAMEDLGDGWRAAGLHDAVEAGFRERVIARKKAFQDSATLTRSSDIFSEIEALHALTVELGCFTHRDIDVFAEYFQTANRKLRSLGSDSAPCHRDGNTANLMVGPDGAVMLLDFDLAANCDPFEDIGCHLAEFFDSEADARQGFEEWRGSFDEGLFQRAMIYGLADDMRWGLIASVMAARSPRSALEFSKYAAWRFLRLEAKAKQSHANNRIRAAK